MHPLTIDNTITGCLHLIDHAGATEPTIGYVNLPADHAGWYAHAQHPHGARITADSHPTAAAAVLDLAEQALIGTPCRCGHAIALTGTRPGCRWHLTGRQWEADCPTPTRPTNGHPADQETTSA